MSNEVNIKSIRVLSDNKYLLEEVIFSVQQDNHALTEQKREVYARKNSATILLYNKENKTVILVRQFRLSTYLNGNPDGSMVECCAGTMDEEETPEACIRRETLEETGYRIGSAEKIFEAYMSPASVTEKIHFFIAPYDAAMKVAEGGGLEAEQEYLEIIELPFAEAYGKIGKGEIIDAKTIMLLQYAQLHVFYPW